MIDGIEKKNRLKRECTYGQTLLSQNSLTGKLYCHCTLLNSNGPIDEVKVFDLRESMRNGGGPACLRQRVVLTEAELQAVTPQVLMNDDLFSTLNTWVDRFYRDRLLETDLADPQLLNENRQALDELTQILALGSIYPFQQ